MAKKAPKPPVTKKLLRKRADMLWSLAVRLDWNEKCAVCGRKAKDAHHLISRRYEKCRYALLNGVALCAACHTFDGNPAGKGSPSAHGNSRAFAKWLDATHPNIAQWVDDNTGTRFEGTTNEWYLCDVIRDLKQYVPDEEYERIVGVKLSQWLDENE